MSLNSLVLIACLSATDVVGTGSGNRRSPGDSGALLVVRASGTFTELHHALENAHATALHYVPERSLLVDVPLEFVSALAADPHVSGVAPYLPALRIDAGLRARRSRTRVLLFARDARAATALEHALESCGGVRRGKRLVEAWLSPREWRELAHSNRVLRIEAAPAGPAVATSLDMSVVRAACGADALEDELGLTGDGVRGEVLDDGFNLGHLDFQSRPLLEHGPVFPGAHGASTSGIIFGDGTGDPAARGLLPSGQGIVASFSLLTNRYDHTAELLGAPYFAAFQSASAGSSETPIYTSVSADLDETLFDLDFVLCQSQGNTGALASRPEAWAKNAISVGGITHNDTADPLDDCWSCGTPFSYGPAVDGRLKPDLVHFSDAIHTVDDGAVDAYRTDFGGTSSATAIVGGHVGLLFELWASGELGNSVDPGATVFENRCHAATAKALLLHTTAAYAFEGSAAEFARARQGWGVPNLAALQADPPSLIVDESIVLTEGEVTLWQFEVTPTTDRLSLTLCYRDPPALPGTRHQRVNDLTLRAISPSGVEYWGNRGLHDGPWSVPGGGPDTLDPVERLLVPDPEPGSWQIEVVAAEIPIDGHPDTTEIDVAFALVGSGGTVEIPALFVRLPSLPARLDPGVALPITVDLFEGSQGIAPDGVTLHHRAAPDAPFTSIDLDSPGGTWEGVIPPAGCGDTLEFYLTAQSDTGTTVTLPSLGPDGAFRVPVRSTYTLVSDAFETESDWSTSSPADDATGGIWVRVDPHGTPAQPEDDASEIGTHCYVTGQGTPGGPLGEADVDNGVTTLVSPNYDLSPFESSDLTLEVRFARWYSNSAGVAPAEDRFEVEVSNNAGVSWTPLEVVGPAGPGVTGGWIDRHFRIDAAVALTETMSFRFVASDLDAGSIVEAAVDEFRLVAIGCEDCNDNGIPDPLDVAAGTSIDADEDGTPDECQCTTPLFIRGDVNGDADVDVSDAIALLDYLFQGGPGADPAAAMDVNDDGGLDVADAVWLLSYLYSGGPEPAAPFPGLGCG